MLFIPETMYSLVAFSSSASGLFGGGLLPLKTTAVIEASLALFHVTSLLFHITLASEEEQSSCI